MEVSLKELKEWQDKMYSIIHNFERLNKYPNSRLGYLIDALYDTMGDIPFCIDELDESEILKIVE